MRFRFLIVLNPKHFNMPLLWALVAAFALLGGWIVWSMDREDKVLLESDGVMKVAIDPVSKKPFVDLDVGNPFGNKSFHAAVHDQEFMVRGVQVRVAAPAINTITMPGFNQKYVIQVVDDLLTKNCLNKLVSEVNASSTQDFSLKNLVKKVCGESVFPRYTQLFSESEDFYSSMTGDCEAHMDCPKCFVVKGHDSPQGTCESGNVLFKDVTNIVGTSNGRRLDMELKPLQPLPWMKAAEKKTANPAASRDRATTN